MAQQGSSIKHPPVGVAFCDPKTGELTPAAQAWFAALKLLPSWSNATRPPDPDIGESGFNTDLGALETWSGGGGWV